MKRIAKFIGTMVLMSQRRGSFEMTNLSPARPRYSPARRIPLGPSGDLLFLSGIICHDDDARDNIEEQTRRIFARVTAVLKNHNAAITDIVKTTSY